MNITLTNEQFEQIKDAIVLELKKDLVANIQNSVKNYAKSFQLNDYEKNEIKKVILESISNTLIETVDISKIETELKTKVNKHVKSLLNDVFKNKIKIDVNAFLQIDEEK